MLIIGRNLQKKKSEDFMRSTSASLSFKGQATKKTTVKWSIASLCLHITNFYIVEKIVFQENREEISVLLN